MLSGGQQCAKFQHHSKFQQRFQFQKQEFIHNKTINVTEVQFGKVSKEKKEKKHFIVIAWGKFDSQVNQVDQVKKFN